jgi:hypothetical protein
MFKNKGEDKKFEEKVSIFKKLKKLIYFIIRLFSEEIAHRIKIL